MKDSFFYRVCVRWWWKIHVVGTANIAAAGRAPGARLPEHAPAHGKVKVSWRRRKGAGGGQAFKSRLGVDPAAVMYSWYAPI